MKLALASLGQEGALRSPRLGGKSSRTADFTVALEQARNQGPAIGSRRAADAPAGPEARLGDPPGTATNERREPEVEAEADTDADTDTDTEQTTGGSEQAASPAVVDGEGMPASADALSAAGSSAQGSGAVAVSAATAPLGDAGPASVAATAAGPEHSGGSGEGQSASIPTAQSGQASPPSAAEAEEPAAGPMRAAPASVGSEPSGAQGKLAPEAAPASGLTPLSPVADSAPAAGPAADLHAGPVAGPDADTDPAAAANLARIARGLRSALSQQGGSVTLRLDPPELGAVRIQLEIQGGQVHARFNAETEGVRHLLQHQLHHLRMALENQGLSVQRLEVQASPVPPPPPGLDQQMPDDGRSRGQTGQEQRRPPSQTADSEDSPEPSFTLLNTTA